MKLRLSLPGLALALCTISCAGGDGAVAPAPAGLASASAAGSRGYTVIDLGTFGAVQAQGFAINDAGTVIGRYGPTPAIRSFAWDARSGMRDLGEVDGKPFAALRINNRGDIVGWLETATTPSRAAVRHASGAFEYVGDAAHWSTAWGVNDAGTVVGANQALTSGAPENVFVWTRSGGMQEIAPWGGPVASGTAVNNAGLVVGWTSIDVRCCAQRGFVWESGAGMRLLPSLGGSAWALAINARGEIAGHSDLVAPLPGQRGGRAGGVGTLPTHAVFWAADGTITDLGTLGGRNSIAWAVGMHQDVYGWAENAAGVRRAFRWTPEEGMTELPGLGGKFDQTGGVNARGMIASLSATPDGVMHAVLLVP